MIVPISLGSGITPDETEAPTLKELGIDEPRLEEFVRKNVDVLFPDGETLLIVGQQVRDINGKRCDLVAVDGSGSIVLIELKRDAAAMAARKEPLEFQAIRYVASYARIKTPQELVQKLSASYIQEHEDEFELKELTPSELATRMLDEFLSNNQAERTFNRAQRIILIAASFDPQTLSACAWLAKNDIDIRCLRLTPVRYNEQLFFEIEQMIPPRALDDYFVEIADPSDVSHKTSGTPRLAPRGSLPRMPELFEWELLKPGHRLYIRGRSDKVAEVIDQKHVRYGGQEMSYLEWGRKMTGWSAINIYEWAVRVDVEKTLDALRRDKMEELAAKAEAAGEAPDTSTTTGTTATGGATEAEAAGKAPDTSTTTGTSRIAGT